MKTLLTILSLCFSLSLLAQETPVAITATATATQITWKWHTSIGATAYKFNTVNDYSTATNMGTDTVKVETGLTANTSYARYAWAYNTCGHSSSVAMTKSTMDDFVCGATITVVHTVGIVAPVTKTVTYGTVDSIPGELTKCWITSNLGSDHQANAKNDTTEASAGWYWQFNRMQGYKNDGVTRTPSTTWITDISEDLDWQAANDPCALELGSGWRLPTSTEWANVDASGNWTNWNGPWNSALKMHLAGCLYTWDDSLDFRGSFGFYWSSSKFDNLQGRYLEFFNSFCIVGTTQKKTGATVRCIRE
jgi:hypothetical protein